MLRLKCSLRRLVRSLPSHRAHLRIIVEEIFQAESRYIHQSRCRQSTADQSAIWRFSVSGPGGRLCYPTAYVSRMPTFMIFRGGKPINTIRGADPRALTSAVEAAVKSAPASKPLYSTPGRTLGGPGIKPAQSLNRPASASLQDFFSALIAFFGLYFVTLFSVSRVDFCMKQLLTRPSSLIRMQLVSLRSSIFIACHRRQRQLRPRPLRDRLCHRQGRWVRFQISLARPEVGRTPPSWCEVLDGAQHYYRGNWV